MASTGMPISSTKSTSCRPRLFQEIVSSNKADAIDLLPYQVEVYISKISPSKCATVIQQLGYILPLIKYDDARYSALDEIAGERTYPWPALGHLRRVRRIHNRDDSVLKGQQQQGHDDEDHALLDTPQQQQTSPCNATSGADHTNRNSKRLPKRKRSKLNPSTPVQLEIVLGATSHVDYIRNTKDDFYQKQRSQLDDLVASNHLQLEKRFLPGRPAKSQSELEEWGKQYDGNGWWPTVYFEKQSVEYRQQELMLNLEDEYGFMNTFLLEAIKDAQDYQKEDVHNGDGWFQGQGVVIVCPESNKIVSRSYSEWARVTNKKKEEITNEENRDNHDVRELVLGNPLNTPVMFAIQGVSRLERQAALGKGLDSESFRKGQYLCTGYDVYLTKEPSVFESMALVHSRVRQVVFGIENKEDGGLGGTGDMTAVHCLPGTNHRYRAFKCIAKDQNELYQYCRKLVDSVSHINDGKNIH